jgi:hypothetical protein
MAFLGASLELVYVVPGLLLHLSLDFQNSRMEACILFAFTVTDGLLEVADLNTNVVLHVYLE